MAKASNYYYANVTAHAMIGETRYAITLFRIEYTVDKVPEAEIHLPIGRSASGSNAGNVSSTHGLLSDLAPYTPVEIYVRLSSGGGPLAPEGKTPGITPDEDVLIFTGFSAAPNMNKSRTSGATITVRCFGKTGALSGSTQMARGLTSPIPGDSTWGDKIGAKLGTGDRLSIAAVGAFLDRRNESDLRNVNDTILTVFTDIASMTDSWSGADNDYGTIALERFADSSSLDPVDMEIILPVDAPRGAFRLALANCYSSGLRTWHLAYRDPNRTQDQPSGGGASLWEVLKQYRELFRFSYVPAIENDALIPLIFGLGGDPYVVIDPSEYWEHGLGRAGSTHMDYVTRVALLGTPTKTPFQGSYSVGQALGFAEVKIDAESSDIPPVGIMHTMAPPRYVWFEGEPANASGAGGKKASDSAKPNADTGEVKPYDFYAAKRLGDAYAKAVLQNMLFASRRGGLKGRFRLDIAPGSLVQINTIGERFSDKHDTLFGHVESVILEGGETGDSAHLHTSFAFTNLRSEEEHERYTEDTHPLYGVGWTGGSLTEKDGR